MWAGAIHTLPEVEIPLNPYQGLKLYGGFFVYFGLVEIPLNPYQGLKPNKQHQHFADELKFHLIPIRD